MDGRDLGIALLLVLLFGLNLWLASLAQWI